MTPLPYLKASEITNFTIDSQKYKPHTIHEAKRHFYHFKPDKNMSNTTYLDKFENHIKVIEHAGGTIGDDEGLIISEIQAITPDLDMDSADNDELEEAKLHTKNKYQDIIYLISADRNRYGKMIEDMENRISTGMEGKFPIDLIDAYKYLSTYKADTRNLARLLDEGTFDGVSFALDSNTKSQRQRRNNDRRDRGVGRGGRGGGRGGNGGRGGGGQRTNRGLQNKPYCFVCGDPNHMSYECPNKKSGPKSYAEAAKSATTMPIEGVTKEDDSIHEYQFTTIGTTNDEDPCFEEESSSSSISEGSSYTRPDWDTDDSDSDSYYEIPTSINARHYRRIPPVFKRLATARTFAFK